MPPFRGTSIPTIDQRNPLSHHLNFWGVRLKSSVGFYENIDRVILWVWPPSQDASDHQNYYNFNGESQPKPSFTTVTVRGPHPSHTFHTIECLMLPY